VPRVLRALACVLAVAAVGAAVLAVVAGAVDVPPDADALNAVDAVAFLVGVGAPAAVGLFLILRRPRTFVAWILLVGALSVAVVMAAVVVAERVLRDNPESALGAWALLVAQEWLVLFAWPLALAYRYPNGRLPSARDRADRPQGDRDRDRDPARTDPEDGGFLEGIGAACLSVRSRRPSPIPEILGPGLCFRPGRRSRHQTWL
jgi:hypothetical protein